MMFNRDLVTSGFDTETLVSERYLAYLLLAQIEAGLLPLEFGVVDPDLGLDVTVILHPPADYQRLYEPEPSAELPLAINPSFVVELLPGNNTPVESVAFSPNGLRLASGSWDNAVRLWDVDSGAELNTFTGHTNSVESVAFSPDGARVASGSFDRMVRLWDADSGAELNTFFGHSGPVHSVVFSPDGSRIASGSFDNTIRLWDVDLGAGLAAFIGHSGPVRSVAFSPDGTRLASGSDDNTVRLWDVASGTELSRFTGHAGFVHSVAFSPDGLRLASASQDRSIRLWDVETGEELKTFVGDSGPVHTVAFSPDGLRLASGSEDNSIRVWDVESGEELDTLTGHSGPVRSVTFSPGGARLASGSRDNKIRLWDAETGEELKTIAVVFMSLTIPVSVVDNNTGAQNGPLPAILLINLEIEADESRGLERNHTLRLSLARLDPGTVALLEAAGINPGTVENEVRAQLNRTIPLGVAQGQQVQRIRMQKLFDGPRRSLGFYVDLALRSGPEPDAYHAPRGNLTLAQHFREVNKPIAFATSPGLFALLGPDAKFRQAEETSPGSGEFRFPLREDPLDPDSDKIGRIKGIRVGPAIVSLSNQPPLITGRLMVDVHGEYTDAPGDPDFHLQLFFDPQVDGGMVDWDLDADIDLGLLATLLLVVGGIGLTLLFAPGLAWGSSLVIGTFIGLAVLKGLIAEPLAAKIIEDRLDEDAQASFLDALPLRVPAATRRWDPFYETQHQVVSLVEGVVIDELGIAFEGDDLVLDKQPLPVNHIVIRDEERAGDGGIAALRYRVSDFQRIAASLEANAPGRDRMDFSRSDPLAEPTLVSLTNAQIAERIATKRLLAPITYTAERIFLVDHQIDALLCLSRRERAEERQRLINEFRAATRDEIQDSEGDTIRDEIATELEQGLGRPPTDEEIDEAFDKRLNTLVNERQPDFEENDLPALLEEAVAQVLRFDLAPEEFIERQLASILFLDGKEIITRHNSDGTTTIYYRDHPDGDPRDNLLSLPHYTPPYQPPQ